MWNAGLDEAQSGIKFAGRNINNLRYAEDTTFMAESEEELKSFLMKVKEESEKDGLKLNIQKTKIMPSNEDYYFMAKSWTWLSNWTDWWMFKTINSLVLSLLYGQLSYPYVTTGKTIVLTRQIFVGKVMSLLFNMLSRLVIAFLSRSQASFNFMAAVTICSDFGAQENKVSLFPLFPYLFTSKVMGPDAMIFVFWMSSFKPSFSLSSFTFIKRLFSFSLLSAIGWCHLHVWAYWYFSWPSWFQLVLHPAWHFAWCTLHIS